MVDIEKAIGEFEKILEKLGDQRKDETQKLIEKVGVRYFSAPAAGSVDKHLHSPDDSKPGGLVVHSMLVYENLHKLCGLFYPDCPEDTMIVCGLFHDLGKIGTLEGAEFYVPAKESWKLERGINFDINKDIDDGLTHAQRSVRILSQFYNLTDEEYAAILLHDGIYAEENAKLKYFRHKKSKLTMLLHWADYYSASYE